jgi:hypothetical protein
MWRSAADQMVRDLAELIWRRFAAANVEVTIDLDAVSADDLSVTAQREVER